MFTDGTKVVNVSGPLQNTLQVAVAQIQTALGPTGYVTAGLTSTGHIVVSIGSQVKPNWNCSPLWAGMYDPATKTWVRITSQMFTGNPAQTGTNLYPGQIFGCPSAQRLYTADDASWIAMDDPSLVATVPRFSGLFTVRSNASLFDVFPGRTFPYQSIPALWKTRWAPIATNAAQRKLGNVKRYFFDYGFGASGSPAITSGWTVTPVDGTDTAIGSAYVTASLGTVTLTGSVSGVTPLLSPMVQRVSQDFAYEVGDLGFDVAWPLTTFVSSPAPGGIIADIYGVGVEQQPARDRR
jgi:hypothetical protein